LDQEKITYKILNEPHEAIIGLLKNTVFGTRGLRHSHLDTEERIRNLQQPDFHTLWLNERLVAVAAYCNRTVKAGSKDYNAYYARYFSVDPEFQGQGLGKLLTKKLEEHYRSNITTPSIFYAYIGRENLRSLKVSEHFKTEVLGQFKTLFFSRFFPKTDKRFSVANHSDQSLLLPQLSKQYGEHAQVQFNRIFSNDHYFVLKENNEVIAGIQVNPVRWKIHRIPGFKGWVIQNIVPYMPVIGRLFNPKAYQFLAYEGLYCKPGKEAELLKLMESTLAHFKIYTAMLWLDTSDPLFPFLGTSKQMGFMSKTQQTHPANFVASYINMPEEEVAAFHTLPKYISAFDLT
jgi:GNAT superfamily N-acetyltransferase